MPLEFSCPKCESPLRLANTGLAGKKIRCPKCSEVITVPAQELRKRRPKWPEPGNSRNRTRSPAAPRRPARPDSTTGKPKPRARMRTKATRTKATRGRDRRGRRGRPEPAKGNSTLMWVLIGVGGFVVLCGGCVTVVIVMMNQAVSSVKDAIEKVEKENKAAWPDQWEAGKIYQVADGGLTLTSRLTKTDANGTNSTNCSATRKGVSGANERRHHVHYSPGTPG